MTKTIRSGKNTMRREEITDLDALLGHDGLKRMVRRHLEVLREHCANYPKMDKHRKVEVLEEINRRLVAAKVDGEAVFGCPELKAS